MREFEEKWQKELSRVESSLLSLSDLLLDMESIAVLEQAFYTLLEKVKDCEEKHSRRLYMLEAIQKVCEEMGFSVLKVAMGNPNEPVRLEIDTFAFGIMTFDFALGGNIQSFSNYEPGRCEGCYLDISEKLKNLGVMTDFRYEENQVPLRKMAEIREILSDRQREADA